jgi:hypothetical protein
MAKKKSLAARYKEARADKKRDERKLESATQGDKKKLRALVEALQEHPAPKREDFSQAAARIVRQAAKG